MKRMRTMGLILILIVSLLGVGCEDTDVGMATRAGVDEVRALTLDEEQVKRVAEEIAKLSDSKHRVAPDGHPYARRLERLAGPYRNYDGHQFDFKVYLSPTVNAFAMADGTIRIYSGLMDRMDDRELLFVVGHEMGHVVEGHIQNKIRLAYASSAVRKAIASQQNAAGAVAGSVLGALAESLLNAQFSQQEEREADDFGVAFMEREGYGRKPAISALEKLAAQGGDHSFWSSHPAPDARAQRLHDNVRGDRKAEKPSILQQMITWLQRLWPFEGDQTASMLNLQ
jgi:putative metalloprotease